MSQEELAARVAARLGTPENRDASFRQQTIYKIEQGRRRVLAAELIAIAQALDTSPAALLGLDEERTPVVAAGARFEEARRNLETSAMAYGEAMVSLARVADNAEQLHEVDKGFVSGPLLRQTPGAIASGDVAIAMEVSTPSPRGPLTEAVLKAMKAEKERLNDG